MGAGARLKATVAAAGATLTLTAAQPALAQDAFGVGQSAPSAPAAQGTEQAVISRYWELGRPRPFFGTTIEAGYAYLRPRFVLGYGQPYWRWIGFEAHPVVSLRAVGHYGGVAAAIPGLQFRVGARYNYSFQQSFLERQGSYNRSDLDLQQGPKSAFLALQAELTATVPILAGSAIGVLTGTRTELVPDGYDVYEDSLRAVMRPPYLWRARLGYLLSLGRDGAIRIGPAADVIGLPGRQEMIVRAGLLGSVLLSAHLEIQASFIPVIASPDTIGLAGGDFGQLGISLRWATASQPVVDERAPAPGAPSAE
jgi:hypothetical protein